jgi:hypothetical protein
MNDRDLLDLLQNRAISLENQVKDIDYEIERCVHDVANGADPGRCISFLQDRHNVQSGYIFDLGKLSAQIEDLENRIREQDNRTEERIVGQDLEKGPDLAREDYLDWLRPAISAEEPAQEVGRDERDHHYQGEDRMLEDMHREDREPEDYLDWWKR